MEYYIGIDGGGTKSRLLAVDKENKIIGNSLGTSTNLASNSKEFVCESLRKLFADFFESSGADKKDCIGLCIGSAGLDSKKSEKLMVEIIKQLGFDCKILAVNDSLLVLSAVTKGKPGVVVISGTGSIAYGMNSDNDTIRCGGWGHILDDNGSGYKIGESALKYALRSYDGRGKKTILEETLKKALNLEYLPDCIERVYNDFNKAEIAGYAIYVKEGAAMNDEVCKDIIQEAALELFKLADAVLTKMQADDLEVIVSGGTILNIDMLYTSFIIFMKEKYPKTKVIKIDKEPVMGAIYLAQQYLESVPA